MSTAGWSRRQFLTAAGTTAAGMVLADGLPAAAADLPGTGRLEDIEHVVILMQENRSFDHYFGTLRGVRGFGDRRAVRTRSGAGVFSQRRAGGSGPDLLPWHLDTTRTDAQDAGDLPHDWHSTHLAWNEGNWDGWAAVKGAQTMGYFTREDIPLHHGLAGAFTVCDNYRCSVMGPTIPNRLYHLSGTIDPYGLAGGPATENPPQHQAAYSWTTYPERLERAGISWQVYANDENGPATGTDPYVGDFGCNVLWLFDAYHDALASDDPAQRRLAQRGGLHSGWRADSGKGYDPTHALGRFITDARAGHLPAVSWVIAPAGFSEHPAHRPVDGAVWIQTMLAAIWAQPELWRRTVVLINYDENDGYFDHIPAPVPPPGTAGEYLDLLLPDALAQLPTGPNRLLGDTRVPIGLGPRVPMLAISPYSRGGWVNSQLFDHTSVLRFLEAWTGVREENISPWRRAVCGDLLSCFDFLRRDVSIPVLPDARAVRAHLDATERALPAPHAPLGGQQMPDQEPGTAPARAIPYQPLVNARTIPDGLLLHLANHGPATLCLTVHTYHDEDPPRTATLDPDDELTLLITYDEGYDVAVHGPNGFLFDAKGDGDPEPRATLALLPGPKLALRVSNPGGDPVAVMVAGRPLTIPGGTERTRVLDPLATDFGWYDITVARSGRKGWRRGYAGHLENGRPSRTEPTLPTGHADRPA